ncbi:homoserine kinase [Sandarakinorhabdus sp.]|jgi:homoserine kinase type II|uniref:homoserine kinase n=1 Tax=Sandarakinorhabdus sp. TaxID=1916663 RepID=UPI0028B076C9|nr:homoserine kinase [Sandarakinorhabdus sp.]
MAVYTPVSADDLTAFLASFDVGAAVSFKGIAEGVENSNFLLETTRGRFILTLYEKRVDAGDLPWFLALMGHLAAKGLPVPGPVADARGQVLQVLNGRPACLIEFLPGVSVTEATPEAAREVGAALGRMHKALADFTAPRPNALGPAAWPPLAARCNGRLSEIDAALPDAVARGLAAAAAWPAGLPQSTIHADLFPDNVLMLEGRVTGLIDFYFACTDARAYDVAITHAAWCFSADGRQFFPERAAGLMSGYLAEVGLTAAELAALPRLAAGAALRFTLTRAFDWLNTPADALVTRKDPMAFARRLTWYLAATPEMMGG